MELASLLEAAGAAAPERRIELRDEIAAYGARAIEGVRPWLASPVLAAFAVRVIERAGANGEDVLARKVLRSARSTVSPVIGGDIDWALQRLRPRSHPEPPAKPSAPPPASPVRRDRYLSTVARRRAR